MKPTALCPGCDRIAEFIQVDGEMFRCGNCFHMVNTQQLDRMQTLHDKHRDEEEQLRRKQRQEITNATTAKNR